ncbi:hypothetical protein P9847_05450 [Paenibacillus chibensis]|uniref:Uncharacterized protein n=1 Tax=Paenibacillus chibensis TaxID=59846 RepID=A0ABU6PPE5_9BACL|nr:hypothetical protein [Paenibacillus chibensis]
MMREQELNVFRSPDIRRTIDALVSGSFTMGSLGNLQPLRLYLDRSLIPS